MKGHILKTERYQLDPGSIDRISERIGEFLTEAGAARREVLRQRLITECCLEYWNDKLGAETECLLKIGSSFGRGYLILEAAGLPANPSHPSLSKEGEEDERAELREHIDNSELLGSLGILPEYHYIKGCNVLKLWAPETAGRKATARTIRSLAVGALILGARFLSPAAGQILYDYAVSPVYTLFMRMLAAVSGPMVLFSIMTSIFGMGDMASFGKTGSAIIKRFLLSSVLLLLLAGGFAAAFYPVSFFENGGMGSGMQKLIEMIVEIAPSDVISPLLNGNALQVVFIGAVLGFTILFLSGSIPELEKIVLQLHRVVQQVMRFLGRLMPYFMGAAILKLLLTSTFSQFFELLKPVLLIWGGCVLMIAADTLFVAAQTKTPVRKLLKSTFPASLIGLTTSSTSAALDQMNGDCVENLKVSNSLADFGIPLGQVLFKPSASLSFFVCALFAAAVSGTTINIVFLLMNFIISFVLGVSMAPIAGALVSGFSILFVQLGIPVDYIALAVSVSLLIDNLATMTNVQLLQQEIYAVSEKIKSGKDSGRKKQSL